MEISGPVGRDTGETATIYGTEQPLGTVLEIARPSLQWRNLVKLESMNVSVSQYIGRDPNDPGWVFRTGVKAWSDH